MADAELEGRIAATRNELEATLDEIEERLNVPKRAEQLLDKAKASYEDNPLPWIVGGIVAAVAVAGAVAWALLSDD